MESQISKPLRQANIEQFKTKVKRYDTLDQAIHHAPNDDFPYLRKRPHRESIKQAVKLRNDFFSLMYGPIIV